MIESYDKLEEVCVEKLANIWCKNDFPVNDKEDIFQIPRNFVPNDEKELEAIYKNCEQLDFEYNSRGELQSKLESHLDEVLSKHLYRFIKIEKEIGELDERTSNIIILYPFNGGWNIIHQDSEVFWIMKSKEEVLEIVEEVCSESLGVLVAVHQKSGKIKLLFKA